MSEMAEVLADYTGQLLAENERLREALRMLIEVPREGQELTWQQRAQNVIIRQALGQEEGTK